MPRRKAKIHEEIIECWHLDGVEEGSREWKIIHALAEADEFNDLYATAFVNDDSELFCYQIGNDK